MRALCKPLLLIISGLALIFAGCEARPGSETPSAAAPAASSAPAVPSEPSPAPVFGGEPAPAATAQTSVASPGSPEQSSAAADLAAASGTDSAPAAQEAAVPRRVGEITFVEGSVLLYRGGAAPVTADIGQVVENFDVVQTGPKSRAYLELDPGSPGGSEIRLAENTAFYYESALTDSEARKTVLQLLAGSVLAKVEKLADGEFKVGTDSAVLGVRGTTFVVNTVPDGAMLVTCLEGRVEVNDDSGKRLFAQPGRAVSQLAGQTIEEELVEPDNVADYRSSWMDMGIRYLEKNASRTIESFAGRYSKAFPRFNSAYSKLREQAPILDAWDVARQSGGEPGFTDWIAEKKTVAPVLFDCLSALFQLERPFYRLRELASMHDRGIGAGTLPDGRTTKQFFDSFLIQADATAEKMAYVRRALLLFKYASAGSPLGQFFGAKAEALGSGALFVE